MIPAEKDVALSKQASHRKSFRQVVVLAGIGCVGTATPERYLPGYGGYHVRRASDTADDLR